MRSTLDGRLQSLATELLKEQFACFGPRTWLTGPYWWWKTGQGRYSPMWEMEGAIGPPCGSTGFGQRGRQARP